MIITAKKAANAAGGKTARACDSCLRWRARWYCPADDAFLCQGCDSSVHSANQLASRHERVRLETASNKTTQNSTLLTNSQPGWLHGFTRKARTPRHPKPNPVQISKHGEKTINSLPLVPEIGSEEANSTDENEEEHEILCRVPIFDPFDEKVEDLDGFFSSDVDLAEFAADVEVLLGRGLDDDKSGIEGLGFLGCKEEDDDHIDICIEGRGVKVEDEELEAWDPDSHSDPGLDGARDVFDWNFDYESPVTTEEEEEEEEKVVIAPEKTVVEGVEEGRNIFLRLNYEEVISAWASQGSPWTTGIKPEFNPDVCCPDFMGTLSMGVNHMYGGTGGRTVSTGDGGREARVSRYKEKRRTRLFSKKIRYEVRKLNAEKRPRMKGRFVRMTPGFANYLINE